MDNWYDGFEHPDLTSEEATTVLSQFKSQEEFNVAGLNAKKAVGAPFRFPKSIESLPDDTVRADFASQVAKFHGERVYDEKQLDTVNYAEGLADARMVNDKLKGVLVDFAKKSKMPSAQVQELASTYNAFSTELMNEHNAAQVKEKTEIATKVNDALKTLYGGEEGVKQHTELVKRLFMHKAGLTAQEYKDSAESLVSARMTQDVVLSKALFNIAKALMPEGTTEITGAPAAKTGKESMETRQDRELPKISGHLWPKKTG